MNFIYHNESYKSITNTLSAFLNLSNNLDLRLSLQIMSIFMETIVCVSHIQII